MKIVECPRDAMQGLAKFIPTHLKIRYLNQLLKVGFDTLDFGSFVSPKAIPQLADTKTVLNELNLGNTNTKLLAIVANPRGAREACDFDEISYLGYPMSMSETFQQRNTKCSISEALDDLAEIAEIADDHEKEVVSYLSMGFGNPYGDPYNESVVLEFTQRMSDLSISIVSIADTVGTSTPETITKVFKELIPKFPHLEIGAHLHSTAESTRNKVYAAYLSGVRRIDGAIHGFGGCPMADDKLVGNMATETIIDVMRELSGKIAIDSTELHKAFSIASEVFLEDAE